MDFFKQMAEQLRELEEQQRLAQLAQSTGGFQGGAPANPPQPREQKTKNEARNSRKRSEPEVRRAPLPGSQGDNPCVQSVPSRGAATPGQLGSLDSPGRSLIEELSARLGEAVLMQEILGQPRALKAWE